MRNAKNALICKTLKCALCLFLSPLLAAQQAPQQSKPTATALPSDPLTQTSVHPPISEFVTIPKDTEIELDTLEAISSATATSRQPVRMIVAKDVVINGLVVIPKGTPASGEVSELIKGVPGKRNGFVWVKPVDLTLGNGKGAKLKEYRSGDDACGDMGPCWALFIFAAPFMPFILIAKAVNATEAPAIKQPGKDKELEVCSEVEGFTANRIILKAVDLRDPKPSPLNPAPDATSAPTPVPAKNKMNAVAVKRD